MVQQCCLTALVTVIVCLDAAAANAPASPGSALERDAQAEFAKVAAAVRERFEREAAGDLIGARVAAQNADAHRFRYLDIKREISRLASSVASPSVEALRNPFSPDASFRAPSASSPTRVAPAIAGRQEAGMGVEYRAWDMYRPHESRDLANTDGSEPHRASRATPAAPRVAGARDMYANGVAKRASGDPGELGTEATVSPAEPPRTPLVVYRERPVGRDDRE